MLRLHLAVKATPFVDVRKGSGVVGAAWWTLQWFQSAATAFSSTEFLGSPTWIFGSSVPVTFRAPAGINHVSRQEIGPCLDTYANIDKAGGEGWFLPGDGELMQRSARQPSRNISLDSRGCA